MTALDWGFWSGLFVPLVELLAVALGGPFLLRLGVGLIQGLTRD